MTFAAAYLSNLPPKVKVFEYKHSYQTQNEPKKDNGLRALKPPISAGHRKEAKTNMSERGQNLNN